MMKSEHKDAFLRLETEFPPVAVKFHGDSPKNVPLTDKKMALCQFAKEVQTTGKHFYIDNDSESCSGGICLGMRPLDANHASGQVGADSELYETPAANAKLHTRYPILPEGTARYVEFCPLEKCEFDPDLVICVADIPQAEIIMRATSYISGDLWEQKSSIVNSCAWLYAYPYVSGKVNFCITGMHFGMKRLGVYPPGLYIISIPHQKLEEVGRALAEMPWIPLPFRTDEESIMEMERRKASWKHISIEK